MGTLIYWSTYKFTRFTSQEISRTEPQQCPPSQSRLYALLSLCIKIFIHSSSVFSLCQNLPTFFICFLLVLKSVNTVICSLYQNLPTAFICLLSVSKSAFILLLPIKKKSTGRMLLVQVDVTSVCVQSFTYLSTYAFIWFTWQAISWAGTRTVCSQLAWVSVFSLGMTKLAAVGIFTQGWSWQHFSRKPIDDGSCSLNWDVSWSQYSARSK